MSVTDMDIDQETSVRESDWFQGLHCCESIYIVTLTIMNIIYTTQMKPPPILQVVLSGGNR